MLLSKKTRKDSALKKKCYLGHKNERVVYHMVPLFQSQIVRLLSDGEQKDSIGFLLTTTTNVCGLIFAGNFLPSTFFQPRILARKLKDRALNFNFELFL